MRAPEPPEALQPQAVQQAARRAACLQGRPFVGAGAHGAWQEPWPQAHYGDGVRFYDEVSAARGALGRFTGDQVMGVIKQFAGVQAVAAS